MKFFTKKSIIQKIVFMVIILLLVNFSVVPYRSYADPSGPASTTDKSQASSSDSKTTDSGTTDSEGGDSSQEISSDSDSDDDDHGWSLGGTLVKEILGLFTWIADILMGALNNFMLGANGYGSAMLNKNDPNITDPESWLCVNNEDYQNANSVTKTFKSDDINTGILPWNNKYSVPNMLYSPENIFANNIATFDVNFMRENEYDSIYGGGKYKFRKNADEKSKSSVSILKSTIASWYRSFRNIAIVGLLSVLIYLGIRILISTTASDKAKYKENIVDWVVALCLVFTIQFIMSAVLMITEKCTELFGTSVNDGYIVQINGEKDSNGDTMKFHTNLMGLVRFSAQYQDARSAGIYTIMYWALVIYTGMFTVMYIKRFLYMAFFTMIAPLVAITYPIDRAGDGKSQAFNIWFKEYTMNAIIQPIHLIIYSVFIGSAYELVARNPIYAIVALGFIVPAEKFVKKMFGLDKAETPSGFVSFAALAMNAFKGLANLGPGGKDKKGKNSKSSGDSDEASGDSGIFMPPNSAGDLSTFGSTDDSSSTKESPERDRPIEDAQDSNPQSEGDSDTQGEDTSNNSSDNLGENNPNEDLPEMMPQEDDFSGRFARPRRIARRVGRYVAPRAGAMVRVGARGAKAVGKQVWKNKGKIIGGAAGLAVKTGMRGFGAAMGGAVGLAAGITTGDFSKAAQFMGAGALTGSSIGGNAYNALSGAAGRIPEVAGNARNAYNEEMYGLQEAAERKRQRQNAKARKEFMRNDAETRKYKELAAKMDYNGNIKNLMSAAADYKEAGITDDTLIQNALKAEYSRNKSFDGKDHSQFVDMASFAHQNGYTKDYIDDDKKRTSLENVISSQISNPNAQREAAQTFAEIFDRGEMYKKVGKLGKNNK